MEQVRNPRRSVAGFPRYGHIFDVGLDPVVGSEIGKRRPALIVSNDVNNEYAQTVTVVPLTGQSSERHYPFEVLIPRGVAGLTLDARAKCNQVRTVDKRRLAGHKGALTHQYMLEVEKALKVHLNLS